MNSLQFKWLNKIRLKVKLKVYKIQKLKHNHKKNKILINKNYQIVKLIKIWN